MNGFELIRTGKNEQAEITNFCTMPTNTTAEKKALYNATQGNSEKLIDQINKQIRLAHVYAEPTTAQYVQEDGEVVEKAGARMILIDTEGNSYRSSSAGIAQSLSRIFSIFGMPDEWEEPITVEVKRVDCKNGNTYILEIV